MINPDTDAIAHRLPAGYRAVPVQAGGEEVPVRLCVVLRAEPDATSESPVVVRDLLDARVFLGCLVDAGAMVLEWLEIWVQNVDGLHHSPTTCREYLCNHVLDQRWIAVVAALHEIAPEFILATGWEEKHSLPAFISPANGLVHPVDPATGHRLELCRDDAKLESAGLPRYSTSLFRYLSSVPVAEPATFYPVVAEAPLAHSTAPLESVWKDNAAPVPFNPQGGLMMVCRHYPLAYEDYADVLGGKAWSGAAQTPTGFALGNSYRMLEDAEELERNGARLFSASLGRAARYAETLFLKLNLVYNAMRAVRAFVKKAQLPFLNLAPDSFRVKLEDLNSALPFLWTPQCALVRPGQALALTAQTTTHTYYVRVGKIDAPIFLPDLVATQAQGMGTVRLRKVIPHEAGSLIVEGTLVMHNPIAVTPNDLIWLRVPLPGGRVDLYAHASAADSLAFGEVRFRSVPQKVRDAEAAAIRASEGASFARSVYEIVPMLSSPCDLFSLGVMAVRTLLVDDTNTLATALDEMLSLARQAGLEYNAQVPLASRIASIFAKDPRYMISLGPQHLARQGYSPEQALRILPGELWFACLGAIVRMFPGMGPESICRDFGDAPSLALESVFDKSLRDWQELLTKARSLIFIDWTFNREVNAVIQKLLNKA